MRLRSGGVHAAIFSRGRGQDRSRPLRCLRCVHGDRYVFQAGAMNGVPAGDRTSTVPVAAASTPPRALRGAGETGRAPTGAAMCSRQPIRFPCGRSCGYRIRSGGVHAATSHGSRARHGSRMQAVPPSRPSRMPRNNRSGPPRMDASTRFETAPLGYHRGRQPPCCCPSSPSANSTSCVCMSAIPVAGRLLSAWKRRTASAVLSP